LRILGVDPSQFNPRPSALRQLVHEEDRRAFSRWLVQLAAGTASQGLDVRILGDGVDTRHVHVLGEALLSDTGNVVGLVGTIQDATDRTRAIQQIHRLAYFDMVTELPNRSRFHEKLAETLEAANRDGSVFAIMFLDLDQFKRINDTLGHAVGDDLLRVIAQRLTRGLRPDDIAVPTQAKAAERDVCRHGGDEFIVLLNGVASEEDAARAATRLLAMLAQPIASAPTKYSFPLPSASCSIRAMATISTRCSRMRTWPCITPRRKVAAASSSIMSPCARRRRSGFRSSTICARRSKTSSSSCTTSRRSK
jgi:diguanylate cyclase (GGDEF)-like protein